ncbi:Uncharacterised protein g9266 [Pycnogonum litorale]
MVHNYVRTTTQQSWTEVSMKEAITKLRQKEMSFNEASDTYGIPKTTLFRRMKKRRRSYSSFEKGALGDLSLSSARNKKRTFTTTFCSWRVDYLA